MPLPSRHTAAVAATLLAALALSVAAGCGNKPAEDTAQSGPPSDPAARAKMAEESKAALATSQQTENARKSAGASGPTR